MIALLLLVAATAACLYHLILTSIGRRAERRQASGEPHTIAVLIPAHNEAASLPGTLAGVAAADYPADRVRVYVIADNCTDATAEVARRHGAVAIERTDPANRGKGFALAFALPRVLADAPDAVLVLDADCELTPGSLRAYDATLAAGADVAQGAVRGRADDSASGLVAAVGAELDSLASAGRDRLGLRVPLRGTGMCLRRSVLERLPWDATGLAEDAEYSRRLGEAGVRVRHAAGAEVRAECPADAGTLCRQRTRWRAALGGPLSWVESKPLVLAELLLAVMVAIVAGPAWAVAWGGGLLLATAGMYLRAAWRVGLTVRRARALVAAPWVVARLLWVTLGGAMRREQAWERTRRNAEAA